MASLTAVLPSNQPAAPVAHRAARPTIGGVIFDLDGTLFDSEPSYRRAFDDALGAFGYAMDDAAYGGLIGLATPDRLGRLVRHFGPDFPAAAFRTTYAFHKQRHLAEGIPLKPGALSLLGRLDALGIPSAVATACSEATARRHLAGAGLLRRFRAVVTRDRVAHRKPHPEAFLRATQALGVPPARCLVLEDSAAGLEAAQAAGARAVLIPDLAPVPAHLRRKSLDVLPDLHSVGGALAGF